MPALHAAFFVAMFLFVSHLQGTVHGYLDPGTGSIAIQLILGGVVALLASVRMYWARLRTFLGPKTDRTDVTHL
jgi:hypothetical protein